MFPLVEVVGNLLPVRSRGAGLPQMEELRSSLDAEDRVILDAARSEFVSHGFRRTTVGDIARRAGVSRPTLYRRVGDKEEIVRAAVFREVVEFFSDAGVRFLGIPDPVDRTVETFVAGIQELRRNPLAQAVLEYDPESWASMVAGDGGRSLELVREVIALGLAGDQISIEAARRASELILRLTASLLVAPSELLPLRDAGEARAFATTWLAPIIRSATVKE